MVSVNNTGATSVVGTANQVAASASTGAITLSTPSVFIAPGTISDTTGMKYSTTASVAAAGTVQGTGTALTTSYNVVTSSSVGSTGVVLPTGTAGLRCVVVNRGGVGINVYPVGSAQIDAAGASASVSIGVGASATYEASSGTQWYTVDAPISAGTSTTVTYGNGTVSVNNTGATSVAGTANQVAASASTGAITLSTPSTFVAPGTISDTTGMKYSTTNSVAAAGSTQGTATALTTSYNTVLTVGSGTGVVLPATSVGLRCVVMNGGLNTLKVYPPSGSNIDSASVNVAVLLGVGAAATYEAASGTQWYTVDQPVVAGTAISITYGPGSATIANTGATSISGTANQVAASGSTGAITLSTPSTFIAPGTISDTTGMKYSTTAAVAAAGTTQGTGTALTTSYNVVSSSSGGSTGVVLPTGTAGLRCVVVNQGSVGINVYPAGSAQIDGAGASVAVSIPVGASATYEASSGTQWYTVDFPIVGGGATYGNGAVTLSATGVTSVTGTANQVATSASSGSITLSTPSVFVGPGTIQDTTGMKYSTTAGVSAAGTTQGTATALTTSYNTVTSVSSGQGVVLPTASAGLRVVITNQGANALSVYPASGAQIDSAGANASVSIPVGASATYEASSGTQWFTIDFPIIGGGATYGNGAVTLSATGVTSVTGTANQVATSASSGSITLSTPSVFIAPGTISDTTGMKYSTTAAVSAAGTTQGGATALTTSYNVVTSSSGSALGVVLPTASAGLICVVANRATNTLNVYPAGSAHIDGAGASTAVLLGIGATAIYEAASATQWYTTSAPLSAGTSTSITYGNGTVSVNNTGATSVSGTANQVTASASTGAITLSTPSTFVAPGTISDTTGMKYSTTTGVAAAGTVQGTGTALTTSYNVVSSSSGGSTGVVLPTGTAGLRCVVVNRGGVSINVYPAGSAQIDAAGASASVPIAVGASATYEASSGTQWYTVDAPLAAGTATTVTYGNGTVSVNNTGATSVSGTANQVVASASTGAITLSTPSVFIAPGTIQDTSGMKYSTTAGVSAAGTTQGTATAITTSYNTVTTVGSGTGVVLPTASAGLIVVVANRGANSLNVYPASGAAIDGASTNTAVSIGIGATAIYEASSATQWYTTAFPISNGTSTTVSYGNGTVSINNTGATSISGTANQVAASGATGAITLSTPSTFIAPGTISDTTGMKYSTTTSVAAAGTVQGTGTALTTSYNVVTSSSGGSTGVVLPTGTAGLRCVVVNRGGVGINVYPASGAAIDAAATNTAVALGVGASATYEAASGTQWYTVDVPVVAGTATTVTYGNGSVAVNNTGATSVAGTANQITASASTGAITLSTPSTFIAPGTIQDTTGMKYSTTGGITATGSTQATAFALTTSYNVVTIVAASTGVALPTMAAAGLICVIVNRGANALLVYPANGSGAAIDGAAANTAVSLPVNTTAVYEASSATQWYTTAFPITAGSGTSVVYGNGSVAISSTGVTSVAGTANEVAVSGSTGAVTISTPSTFVAPGTISDTTGMKYSTTTSVAAAGTVQGTGTALTTSYNVVSSSSGGSTGVVLPTGTAGLRCVVVNRGGVGINVYPAGSAQIDAAGASASVPIAVGASATYQATSAGQWYTVDVPVVAGTNVVVTPGNGQTSVATSTTPTFVSETLTATTNQLVLGTTHTTTISATAPAASVVYTLGDAGGAASIPLVTGAATSGYVLTATGTGANSTWQNPVTTGIIKTVYTLTGPAIFTPPVGAVEMYVTLVGGGGSGGGANGANGGGGSAHALNKYPITIPAGCNPCVVNIGAGGVGGLNTANGGGNSTFVFNTTVYNNGTASATSSATVTGAGGTVWNSAMVGGTLVSGATLVNITGWTSATSITVASAVTISGAYTIYYSGNTVYSTGTASQSGTTITGTGFIAAEVGGYIVFATAAVAPISGFTNSTTLVGAVSQSVGTNGFNLYYGIVTLYNTGTVGTGGSPSATVTGAGGAAFTSAMIGGSIVAAGETSVIVNVGSSTSLTVSPTITITNGSSYTIYYSNSSTVTYTAYGGGAGGNSGTVAFGGGGGGAGGADTTGAGGPASTVWPQLGPAGGAGGSSGGGGAIGLPGAIGGFSVSGSGGGQSQGNGAYMLGNAGGIGTSNGVGVGGNGGGGAGGFRGIGGNGSAYLSNTSVILLGTGAGSSGANPSTFTTLGASDINIFVSIWDYIYVGSPLPFSSISYNDTHLANTSITPLFSYSLSGTTWQTISGSSDVVDHTSGFTSNNSTAGANINFRGPPYTTAAASWQQQTISGTTAYWFRIQRSTVTVATVPKASTGTLLLQQVISGGYSALANTGAGGGGGETGGGVTLDVSGGDGGSGWGEIWYE